MSSASHRVKMQIDAIIGKAHNLKDELDTYEYVLAKNKEALDAKTRIIEDLKAALREALVAQPIKDPVLVEAMVRGIAEEGGVGSRSSRGY